MVMMIVAEKPAVTFVASMTRSCHEVRTRAGRGSELDLGLADIVQDWLLLCKCWPGRSCMAMVTTPVVGRTSDRVVVVVLAVVVVGCSRIAVVTAVLGRVFLRRAVCAV